MKEENKNKGCGLLERFGNAAWGFRETPLEEQLAITRKMGFPFLELGIANAPYDLPLDIPDLKIEEVRRLFDSYGVRLDYAATGNDFTTGSREDVQKVKRVIDICEKLGVRVLRVFAGFSPAEEVTGRRWDVMADCLKEAAMHCRTVSLAIETHGGVRSFPDGVEHFHSAATKPELLERLLRSMPENVGILFDPANLWAVGIRHPEKVYELIRERVLAVHLKDFAPASGGHLRPAACGESGMDWAAILDVLAPDLPLLFEYENVEDVEEGLKKSLLYVESTGHMVHLRSQ